MSKRKPAPSMWWKHPYCYYCGKQVVKSSRRPRPSYSDVGTVEHIPPLWIARLTGEKTRRVLACYSCNKRKNKEIQEMFPVYFFQLWNGGDLPRSRKMLMKGPA